MITLPVPDQSWSRQKITLAGLDYTFIYSYNGRDKRWRFDLYLDEQPVILGIKVMENQFFFEHYILPLFDHGDVACLRVKDDGLPAGRNNFGPGKSYELVYFTNEEFDNI